MPDDRLEAEQQNSHSDDDDLEEGEVYDEEEDDTSSDSDEITMEMLQDELRKLKDGHRNKAMNDTSNVMNSCNATQDETFETNSTKSEQSDHTVNSVQESKDGCLTELENTSENTNTKQKKRVSFVEPCDQNNADEETSANDEPLISEMSDFVEQDNTCNDEDYEDIRIEFSPSSYVPHILESNNAEIQSPVDIYKMFGESIKPILKRSPNDMLPHQVVPLSHEDSSSDTENECNVQTSTYTSVSTNNSIN